MIFGVTLSPSGWFGVIIAAIFTLVAPLLAMEAFAYNFSEPWRTIIIILGCYVLWPIAIAWVYKLKLQKSGKGSLIFYFYVGLYFLLFLAFLSKLFNGSNRWDDYLGVFVLGAVSSGLIWFALQARKKFSEDLAKLHKEKYEFERLDDIQRQAEAILMAEKIKKGEMK